MHFKQAVLYWKWDRLAKYGNNEPVLLDPESFTPRKGLMTKYGKKLLEEGARYYSKLNVAEIIQTNIDSNQNYTSFDGSSGYFYAPYVPMLKPLNIGPFKLYFKAIAERYKPVIK